MKQSGADPADRGETLGRLFAEAVDLPPDRRSRFIEDACAGEGDLQAELKALLAAHDTLTTGARTFMLDRLDAPRALALLRDAAETFSPGAFIGPYRVLREVGHGGMGVVYLAQVQDGKASQQVAVKVVRPWVLADPKALKRFEAERQIVATLSHSGIARLLDSGVLEGGRPWFAMEYVDGRPIDEYTEARDLTSIARLSLVAAVCDVVDHAHTLNIVHRDLKPTNILVTDAGAVKLLDFGIAKLLADTAGLTMQALTGKGARPMTLEYASPEQLLGEHVSPATDVYALGVILYRLLTGRHPYRTAGAPLSEVPKRILLQTPEPPSGVAKRSGDLDASLWGDVDRIVLKALRKAPAERYRTAGELAAELRRCVDLSGLSA